MSMSLVTGRARQSPGSVRQENGQQWKAQHVPRQCWCHSPGVGSMKGSMVPTGDGLTWTERVRQAGGCWEAQGDWRRRAGPGRGWALGRGDLSELTHARQECLRGGSFVLLHLTLSLSPGS